MIQKDKNMSSGVIQNITKTIRKRLDEEQLSTLAKIEDGFGEVNNVYFRRGIDSDIFDILDICESRVNGYPLLLSHGFYKQCHVDMGDWLEIGLYTQNGNFEDDKDFSVQWLYDVGGFVLHNLNGEIEPLTIHRLDTMDMVMSDQEIHGFFFWDGGDGLRGPSPIELDNGRSIKFLYTVPVFKQELEYLENLDGDELTSLLERKSGTDVFNFTREPFYDE